MTSARYDELRANAQSDPGLISQADVIELLDEVADLAKAEPCPMARLGQLIEEVRQGGHITLTETPNQTPSAGIIVWADWTNFEKRQFNGDSILDALRKARKAMPSG